MTIRLRHVLAFAAAGALLLLVARRVDWASTALYLDRVGARALWALVPYFFVLLFDALGWQSTFYSRPSLWDLWRLRAGTEALAGSLPAGAAFGESLRVLMVHQRIGLPITTASANAIVTKVAIALAQGLFVTGSLALTFSPHGGRWHLGTASFRSFAFVVALGCFYAMAAALRSLARARPVTRLVSGLRHLGSATLRRWSEKWASAAAEVDAGLTSFSRLAHARRVQALAWFLLGWLALGAEDWLILSFLTPSVSFAKATTMEGLVSLVRIGFFFLPGALGAQEVSYFGLLQAYGVPDAVSVSAAFVAIKRAKEVAWIAFGYLLLAGAPPDADQRATHRALDATEDSVAPSNDKRAVAAKPIVHDVHRERLKA